MDNAKAKPHRAPTAGEINAAGDDDARLRSFVVAALVGVKPDTLMRWVRAGRFLRPLDGTGHIHYWRAGAVRQWLRERQAANSSSGPASAGASSAASRESR